MMQAEKVAGDLRDAHDAVAGDASPVPALSAAVRRLERRGAQAPALVEPAVKALDAALNALDEARGHLEHALRVADHDPQELERIEERLFALRAAGRKYNSPVDALDALGRALRRRPRADRRRRRAARGAGEGRRARRERAMPRRPRQLSAARKKAAEKLDKAVNGELKPLKLERAKFSTADRERRRRRPGRNGIDRVEFWVQTNPGTRPGPLMKVASGGELARFLLALKVVLADRGSAPTLVFDEIDTGVGGAVADAIGVRLARLARPRAGRHRHACAAGRRPRRAALPHHQGRARQGQARRDPRHASLPRRAGARRSRACWPAPRSPRRRAPPPRS